MSQEQWIILLLKMVLISGFASIAVWICVYTKVAKWWRNPVGRSLVTKSALVAVLLIPTTLSLFFDLNRKTSLIVAWADVGLIGLITPVMLWRSVVWWRLHRAGTLTRHDLGGPGRDGR